MGIYKPLQDFIDKHVEDLVFMLDRYFIGGTIDVIDDVFTIVIDSRFERCEIENLVWSGSKFNVDGVIVVLIPIFI